jgi:hypothetical protein
MHADGLFVILSCTQVSVAYCGVLSWILQSSSSTPSLVHLTQSWANPHAYIPLQTRRTSPCRIAGCQPSPKQLPPAGSSAQVGGAAPACMCGSRFNRWSQRWLTIATPAL